MSNEQARRNAEARLRGFRDGTREDYDPPDGVSWGTCIEHSILGESEENENYRKGYEEGKQHR